MNRQFVNAIATSITAMLAQGSLQNDLGQTANEYASDMLGEMERNTEAIERVANTLDRIETLLTEMVNKDADGN